jgi:hypothetical protein
MLAGYRAQRRAVKAIQSRQVAIIETSAKEALSRGDKPLNAVLSSAANDVRTTGELHPMTVVQLKSLGVVA